MDYVFWSGILIGAILSLIASVAANLLNNKIQSWLERRRKKTNVRRRSKEKITYRTVHGLKTGRLSQSYYFSVTTAICTVYSISGFFFSASSIALLELLIARGKFRQNVNIGEMNSDEIFWFSVVMSIIFFAIVLAGLTLQLLMRIMDIGRKLNAFDGYRKKLAGTYPDFPFARLESSEGIEGGGNSGQVVGRSTSP